VVPRRHEAEQDGDDHWKDRTQDSVYHERSPDGFMRIITSELV
jgi:hypothetical protein